MEKTSWWADNAKDQGPKARKKKADEHRPKELRVSGEAVMIRRGRSQEGSTAAAWTETTMTRQGLCNNPQIEPSLRKDVKRAVTWTGTT